MKTKVILALFLAITIGLGACKKDKGDTKSSNTALSVNQQSAGIAVTPSGNIISISACKQKYNELISGNGLSLAALGVVLADSKATVSPSLDTPKNFGADVKYTVTAENGASKEYTVKVSNSTVACP